MRNVLFACAMVVGVSPLLAAEPALESTLEKLLRDQIFRTSQAGMVIAEVETGRIVAQHGATRPLIPASNMKLFTTSAGLELLGPDYEFLTRVSVRGEIDEQGVLHGDLRITGGGDPTIGARLHDGEPTEVMRGWGRDIQALGIRSIDGDLVFEHGFFDDQWVHPTWPENQLTHWYEAPVSALALHEGCVTVRVLPGRAGGAAKVQLEPENRFVEVENTCVTSSRGRGVIVARSKSSNTIFVQGNIKPRSGAIEVIVALQDPVHYFASVTRDVFAKLGIQVKGKTLLVARDGRPGWRALTNHATPLSVVNLVINKKSQNHYAEQLIKTIGAERSGVGSWSGGSAVIRKWLLERVRVAPEQIHQVDGSGMSRDNRASAMAFVQLLRYMWAGPHRRDLVNSLPYSGEPDSRLKHRMSRPPYAHNVYAKTGYLSKAIGLSGYVRGESGKVYAFSMLFNAYRVSSGAVYKLQDQILEAVVRGG